MGFRANTKIKKCLLLGSGSSGKSTLFRQLKVIHGSGFGADEFVESKQRIRSNCVLGILVLLKKSQELYDQNNELNADCFINIDGDEDRKYIINEVKNVLKFSAESFEEEDKIKDDLIDLGASIKCLWQLPEIQCTYSKRQSFSIIENLDYFLNKTETIFHPKYEVLAEDHLKCRIRTTGMILADYVINKVRFHIYDVGGQRNERKKWIHLFDDECKHAMVESLMLFGLVSNSRWFGKSEIILFLNKNDVFRKRLKEGRKLSICFNKETFEEYEDGEKYFEEYKGPIYIPNPDDEKEDLESLNQAHEESVHFIQKQYLKRCQSPNRIFVHITTATDQKNIRMVFWDVQNIVINSNLRKKAGQLV